MNSSHDTSFLRQAIEKMHSKSARMFVAALIAMASIVGIIVFIARDSGAARDEHSGDLGSEHPVLVETATEKLGADTDERHPLVAPKAVAGAPRSWIDDLRSRSESGDAEAAKELFDSYKECYVYDGILERLDPNVRYNVLTQQLGDNDGALDQLSKELDEEQLAIDRAKKAKQLCSSFAHAEVDEDFYEVALLAAKLGDDDAADCYASGAFAFADHVKPSEKFLRRFRENARGLIARQFARGDWRAIVMYADIYAPESLSFGLSAELRDPDLFLAYRYTTLRGLIADDETKARFVQSYIDDPVNLPVDEVAAADAWAAEMKNKYFRKVDGIDFSKSVSLCPY